MMLFEAMGYFGFGGLFALAMKDSMEWYANRKPKQEREE